jgi:hypothetical protein
LGEVINEMLGLICSQLVDHPDAKISFPNHEKKMEYAALIKAREPTVENCIGFKDAEQYSSYHLYKLCSGGSYHKFA